MERQSVARWWELRSGGKAALLMTPTNEAAERLNARCQHTRIRHGQLDTSGPSTTVGAHRIFAGDEVATRQNDRSLVTDRGVTVKNRAVWTIDQIHPDGSLIATGKSGTVMLPGEYVAEHVDLAYARTGMGGQGRTVKGGLLFADRATDLRNLYVPMTRGTELCAQTPCRLSVSKSRDAAVCSTWRNPQQLRSWRATASHTPRVPS